MSELIIPQSHETNRLPLPASKLQLNIRPALAGDLPFIDRLQKMHTKAVGWMPTNQLEGCIRQGKVIVAWASRPCLLQDVGGTPTLREEPVGYLLAADRYFKRDDVGIIYQMNVLPERQRGFVAASLLKAQFERSAYGCKLYCCWCAQDLAANKFWEAMGFVPLAFRTGGTNNGSKPARMHIFWQKRIRSGDESTPWWFPSETSGGAIKANRVVLPIPPGTHWSEAKPIVLPGLSCVEGPGELSVVGFDKLTAGSGQLSVVEEKKPRQPRVKVVKPAPIRPNNIASGGLRFADPKPVAVEKIKPMKQTRNDPRLVAAARELKDRWLEQVNAGLYLPQSNGKYEVSRAIEAQANSDEEIVRIVPALPAAVAA